jgi:nucleotide-binding universal stress UspA family protein
MPNRPILIAYDGSDYARTAIAQAAEQLDRHRRVMVLTVFQPIDAAYMGFAVVPAGLDEDIENDARRVAEEGAKLAREAGFEAKPLVELGSPVWQRIVEAADERDVGVVVLGSHGRTGIQRVLLGSVAAAVAAHTNRAVLIAHKPDCAPSTSRDRDYVESGNSAVRTVPAPGGLSIRNRPPSAATRSSTPSSP